MVNQRWLCDGVGYGGDGMSYHTFTIVGPHTETLVFPTRTFTFQHKHKHKHKHKHTHTPFCFVSWGVGTVRSVLFLHVSFG